MDSKMISLLSLCNLYKGFDSVNHSILLNKCAKLNVDSFGLGSYLGNKTQSAKLNNTTSGKAHVQFGVPQGSILGPVLFSIYVNDISGYITDCTLIEYADDTQLLHQGYLENIHEAIIQAGTALKKIRKVVANSYICPRVRANLRLGTP